MFQNGLFLRLLVLVSLAVFPACQSLATFYLGKQVRQEHVVSFVDTDQEKRWATFDLSVQYRVEKSGDQARVYGHVELSDHYRVNYEKLWRLDVYLLLLDKEARVVETRRLALGVRGDIEGELVFDERLTLSPEVEAFSFAYEGVAQEMRSEGGSSSSFWLYPR